MRIGIHLAGAQQVSNDYRGTGVNGARIAVVAGGGEILGSQETVEGTRFATTHPRSIQLKGVRESMDVVSVEWK